MTRSPEKPSLQPSRLPIRAEGTPGEVRDHKDDIFFAAIEMTRMPMLVTDPRQPDNPIVFANRAFLSMTGYTPEELIGTNCRFLQGPATDRASVAVIREAIESRTEVQIELLNYRKDGSTFWNALFISPVYNPAGELVYFFASQLDVSRRRDAEEGLAQAQKMEALGQLTGGISHDFNNLLQVMSGHLDLLEVRGRMNKLDPEHVGRGVENIREAVSKASKLTSQLLAFSRKQSLRGRVINLNAVTKDMTDLAQRTLGEQIQVVFKFEQDIGNCQLDPTQLEVALLNVLVNARDAMPEGGTLTIQTGSVEVSDDDTPAFSGLAPGRYSTLSVTDTGTGIDKALLARVMDPFFTTKEEGKGTGLGLSMVYGFVKQSGGTVTMYSEVGIGTTVRMYFPTVDARPAVATRSAHPAYRGGTERILLVEDREEVGLLAQEMLEGLGYTVLMANSAQQALRVFRGLAPEAQPDLLFSDVVMPGGMNGYTLAREIQKLRPSTRVLLTTGFDRDLGSLDHVAPAEFEILKKPYRLGDLARKVRDVLDGPTGSHSTAG
ncbi:histidine kinase famiy protein [Pseudacidovorax intermedius]|uniref:histidine kinase n=1 Tax=Pseudacidovorax intermedius TaxID=433924 RepID=A0A147HC86_9BURK|nr:histidine kinase famiy protein [Pseudacidovorax intermedius]KTT27554.1 histidine kinase [Pseudacidovorax intermedius]